MRSPWPHGRVCPAPTSHDSRSSQKSRIIARALASQSLAGCQGSSLEGSHMLRFRVRITCLAVLGTMVLASGTVFAQAPAPQPAPPGDVVGVGNFAHIVADLDRA